MKLFQFQDTFEFSVLFVSFSVIYVFFCCIYVVYTLQYLLKLLWWKIENNTHKKTTNSISREVLTNASKIHANIVPTDPIIVENQPKNDYLLFHKILLNFPVSPLFPIIQWWKKKVITLNTSLAWNYSITIFKWSLFQAIRHCVTSSTQISTFVKIW